MLIRYFLIKFYLWWSKDQRSLQIELRFNYDIQFHWLLKSQPFFPRGQKTFQNKNKVFIDIKRTLIIDFLTVKFGSFSFIGQQIWRKKILKSSVKNHILIVFGAYLKVRFSTHCTAPLRMSSLVAFSFIRGINTPWDPSSTSWNCIKNQTVYLNGSYTW